LETKNYLVQLFITRDKENLDKPDAFHKNLGESENILKKENNNPLEESIFIYKTDIK